MVTYSDIVTTINCHSVMVNGIAENLAVSIGSLLKRTAQNLALTKTFEYTYIT